MEGALGATQSPLKDEALVELGGSRQGLGGAQLIHGALMRPPCIQYNKWQYIFMQRDLRIALLGKELGSAE